MPGSLISLICGLVSESRVVSVVCLWCGWIQRWIFRHWHLHIYTSPNLINTMYDQNAIQVWLHSLTNFDVNFNCNITSLNQILWMTVWPSLMKETLFYIFESTVSVTNKFDLIGQFTVSLDIYLKFFFFSPPCGDTVTFMRKIPCCRSTKQKYEKI